MIIEKNDFITPRVISILGEFGEKEARFLKILSEQDKFRMPYSELLIISPDEKSYRVLSRKVLCTENSEILLDYDSAIDTLVSLGLIRLEENKKFVADYYKNQHSMIENKLNSQDWHKALLPGERLDIRCSSLHTTILGKDFINNIVIDSEFQISN
ncbi:Abi-alpha family protein [Lactobacillus acidophilus]|uniref:Abi-alpha family protein n=1 Tax=Lactobacillus acidophilus TaxID=1579 RepID=UPI0013DE2F3E|nr:Abi-alpha family protein [Lactobacillus acidophilus]